MGNYPAPVLSIGNAYLSTSIHKTFTQSWFGNENLGTCCSCVADTTAFPWKNYHKNLRRQSLPVKAGLTLDVMRGYFFDELLHGPGFIVFSLCTVSSIGTWSSILADFALAPGISSCAKSRHRTRINPRKISWPTEQWGSKKNVLLNFTKKWYEIVYFTTREVSAWFLRTPKFIARAKLEQRFTRSEHVLPPEWHNILLFRLRLKKTTFLCLQRYSE